MICTCLRFLTRIQAKEQFWTFIEEIDSSVKIKDLAFSLLNPIALNRVANKHIKVGGALDLSKLMQ
jgi:hypothetical protein